MLTNISIEIVLGMPFLGLNNMDIKFAKKLGKLIWRSYTATKALLTINRFELIDKKEFAKIVLDKI